MGEPTFQGSGLGGDLREHLQPFQLPRINQKHDHLSAGLKHEAATFFYLIGFALSPSTRYEMYQKHPVGVHNGADRTQVKLLPPSTHISNSPHLCSLSPSSSWGTLTHPPKPNSNVPYLRKPALLPCGGDGSSLLLPNQSGHSSTQLH